MIKSIAIDDEPVALDVIRNHAEKVPFIELKETFLSAVEALSYLQKEKVQLVFIDINMPDMSGLEFAGLVKQQIQVIFTTAYPEFAINGFELAATDYLLKPINFNRFLQACQLAESRVGMQTSEPRANDNILFVKDGYSWVKINFENLIYAKAEDNYVSLFEDQKHTLTRMTLNMLLTKLPKDQFIQVHKSFVVALAKVEKIEKHQITVHGKEIPISDSFRDSFLLFFRNQ